MLEQQLGQAVFELHLSESQEGGPSQADQGPSHPNVSADTGELIDKASRERPVDLVVVSNRVAAGKPNQPMTGGLAAALLPVVERSGAVWMGSSGEVGDGSQEKASIQELGKGSLARLDLPAADYTGYYEGFANSTLWPALHSLTDRISGSEPDYDSYREINAFMARALLDFKDRDAFWGHDYHFIPLGRNLRKLGIDKPIGFFLHTPWPAPEVVQYLPYHRELTESMLAYDLIGFQTEADRQNFLACIGTEFGLTANRDGGVISKDGRLTQCQVFPIGIDADKICTICGGFDLGTICLIAAARSQWQEACDRRRPARLHQTPRQPNPRFCASMDRAAAQHLAVADRHPSRTNIKLYSDYQDNFARLVSDVNFRQGADDWKPIHYEQEGLSQAVLAGLCRTADVGVVTSLRDGVNLVAKEYVAAQDKNDPGVLILSKFAGAADELEGALLVDPNNIREVSDAITQAIKTSPEERRSRWEPMIKKLRDYTIHDWSKDFIAQLQNSRMRATAGEFPPQDVRAPIGSERRNVQSDLSAASRSSDLPHRSQYRMFAGEAAVPADYFGHIGFGWINDAESSQDVLIDALNRVWVLPSPVEPTTNLRGQRDTAHLSAADTGSTPEQSTPP